MPYNCLFLHRAVPVAADLYQKVKIVLTSVTLQKKKHVTESKRMLLHSFYDLAWRDTFVSTMFLSCSCSALCIISAWKLVSISSTFHFLSFREINKVCGENVRLSCTHRRRNWVNSAWYAVSVVGRVIMLQAGKSRVRDPMRWMNFFFNLPNPSGPWPWDFLNL
jgi:hypothetical protein